MNYNGFDITYNVIRDSIKYKSNRGFVSRGQRDGSIRGIRILIKSHRAKYNATGEQEVIS